MVASQPLISPPPPDQLMIARASSQAFSFDASDSVSIPSPLVTLMAPLAVLLLALGLSCLALLYAACHGKRVGSSRSTTAVRISSSARPLRASITNSKYDRLRRDDDQEYDEETIISDEDKEGEDQEKRDDLGESGDIGHVDENDDVAPVGATEQMRLPRDRQERGQRLQLQTDVQLQVGQIVMHTDPATGLEMPATVLRVTGDASYAILVDGLGEIEVAD